MKEVAMSKLSKTFVKDVRAVMTDSATFPAEWLAKVLVNDDNLCFLIANTRTQEALWVDPVREDMDLLMEESQKLPGYRFICVIDTHTHADHISGAGQLAEKLGVPLVMHQSAPTRSVSLRVSRDTLLPTAAGPLHLLVTPGHTCDGITPIWGPFVFGGDTILYGDTGRDDLPTGNPEEHYQSLQKIKAAVKPTDIFLPGHDLEGGRACSWETQLKVNASLNQTADQFIPEARAFVGRAPKLLKESLFENFK